VIDHHPNEEIEAQFIDHREQIGATATILTEYVRELDIEMDAALGTALLFAIRRETLGFLRGVTSAEYDAAGWLHEHAGRCATSDPLDAVSYRGDRRYNRGGGQEPDRAWLGPHLGDRSDE